MGDKYDIEGLAQRGLDAFFADLTERVRRNYPEITTGDMPPDADLAFGKACEAAVKAWIDANAPKSASQVAACELRVEMRPPKTGERGWMVVSRDPQEALREVLRESEELGWVALRDYDVSPDKNDMIAVTIEIARADNHVAFPRMSTLAEKEGYLLTCKHCGEPLRRLDTEEVGYASFPSDSANCTHAPDHEPITASDGPRASWDKLKGLP